MTVEVGFVVCRGRVVRSGGDLAVEAPVVEPVDVGECLIFDVGQSAPGSFRVDQFPFVETVRSFTGPPGLGVRSSSTIDIQAVSSHRPSRQ